MLQNYQINNAINIYNDDIARDLNGRDQTRNMSNFEEKSIDSIVQRLQSYRFQQYVES